MATESGLLSANKTWLLQKAILATPPAAKLPGLVRFIILHISTYQEGDPWHARGLCRILATKNVLLDTRWNCSLLPPPVSSLPLLYDFIH